ncbi:TPA: endonuclease V [bacterium]|nr:endonuclease V [bacterium]
MKPVIFHSWDLSIEEAKALQEELSKKVILEDQFSLLDIKSIGGIDVSFDPYVKAAIAIMSFPELEVIEHMSVTKEINFPYIPEYLSFREGPIIVELLQKIEKLPDVLLFDGQGIAHPRKFGIASHIGVIFDIPTIGVAKDILFGKYKEPGSNRGSKSLIFSPDEQIIGACLRTRSDTKPVFVSCGHKITLGLAINIIFFSSRFRIPEPIRKAHNLSKH